MKRAGILNQALSAAIAGMGHGDLLMVVDAGFPVPRDAIRIDLAVAQDLPDLETVLALVHRELVTEAVVVAAEMEENNPRLADWLRAEFGGSEFESVPHAEMLSTVPQSAKAIVRTGAFNPWGNVALRSGVDLGKWFTGDGVKVPDYYLERMGSEERAAP